MKSKILILSLVLVMVFGVVGCNKKNKDSDALKFKKEYEAYNGKVNESNGKEYRTVNIKEDNPFIYKTADEIVNMMNEKKTFAVYFGFDTCPWCRSIIESMMESDEIYVLDTG